MVRPFSPLVFVALSTASTLAFSQAQVEERKVQDRLSEVETSSAPTASRAQTAELYYQLQLLQEEVLTLRGLVEEQSYQIKKLKQQRLDDYVDLDRRLSAVETGSVAAASSVGVAAAVATETTSASDGAYTSSTSADSVDPEQEFNDYKSAYRLVTQDPKKAETALQSFISNYPSSQYVANSMFVLGELKLRESDLTAAKSWFSRVIAEHPDHYRVVNAKLKLATVFQQLGDIAQAKVYWTEVAESDSSVAAEAKARLRENP